MMMMMMMTTTYCAKGEKCELLALGGRRKMKPGYSCYIVYLCVARSMCMCVYVRSQRRQQLQWRRQLKQSQQQC